ncbi:rap1 GTPase-GDP dissociation stimulator 1-B-like [Lytechinus pictus]|uniref:rap1 GTPase-GDP dissociation stimulator 1-B-like n=1 Tax=Lytechinus pictus TaxID=7653 RepID=UPI0030BA03E4
MDGVTEALRKLQVDCDSSTTNGCLDCLLQALQEDALGATTEMVQNGGIQCLRDILSRSESAPPNLLANAAKIVAEMAKHEEIREPFVEGNIVLPLCSCLLRKNYDVLVQACRALGNLCCDCDKAREALFQGRGLDNLMKLLEERLSVPEENAENQALWNAACGCLMNLTYDRLDVQKKAVSLGAIDLLITLLKRNETDTGLCGTAIMCFGNLAEPADTRTAFVGTEAAECMVHAIKKVTGDDQLEGILEIIASLVENDDMKLDFAKSGIIDTLLDMLTARTASWTSESAPKIEEFDAVRVSIDLLVLLLTGDECMAYIFQEGEGSFFRNVVDTWMTSQIEYFRISAALAIGNFARNDLNCIKLVSSGIVPQLLRLLKPYEGKEVDTRLTHAVLSALRNLAIPKVNKSIMLSCNTLDEILPLLKSEMLFVQFKLLGTARMLVDSMAETAVDLGQRSEFIQRVVELCACEIHPGVSGEATRLLASLIKHSGSARVMETIVQHGGLPRLVAMATSEHPLMQNEALVALTLIAASHLESSESALLESKLLSTIKSLLQETAYSVEVQCNVLTLAGFLTQSAILKQAMVDQQLPDTIETLKRSKEEPLSTKATSISQHFT